MRRSGINPTYMHPTEKQENALIERLFMFVAIAFLSLLSCGHKNVAPKEEAIPVQVRKPSQTEQVALIRVGGNVEGRESSEVGFQVAGRIRRILVEEGHLVKSGQLLAELDPTDYQYGVEIAAGESTAAAAIAAKVEAGTRKQDLEQARAAFEQADDEYHRMKQLYGRRSLAPNDFKKIEAQWKVAQQRYDEAKEGARKEDIAAALGKSMEAASNLKLNQKRLADTRLLSPINGVVARRLTNAGNMIAAGIPVVALMDLNPVRIRVGVPETEISKVRIGLPAKVRIPSMGTDEFTGKVELVGYAAEPQSRTFAVRILVPNPKLVLRAGMIAEADIQSHQRIRAITVPGEAIFRDAQGATLLYVYYSDKQRVFARRIHVGRAINREVEVTGGISTNDAIVVAGQQNVREGSLVKPMEIAR